MNNINNSRLENNKIENLIKITKYVKENYDFQNIINDQMAIFFIIFCIL